MNLVPVQNKLCQRNASTCQHVTASTNNLPEQENGTAPMQWFLYIYTYVDKYIYIYQPCSNYKPGSNLYNIYIYICTYICIICKKYILYILHTFIYTLLYMCV